MTRSAFLGQPPNTQDDWYIARALLRSIGKVNADPSKGYMVKPSRPPPDQYRYETQAPRMIAGTVICMVFMVVVTGTRLMLRYTRPNMKWGWDDWLIIPGVILAVAWPLMQLIMVTKGVIGKHIYDMTYEDYLNFKRLGTFTKTDFFVAVGVVKMSITIFNLRLTSLTGRKWNIANWTFFTVLVAYTLTAIFLFMFQCDPPLANFDLLVAGKLEKPAKCISNSLIGAGLSIVHVAMDFCLLTVPIIVVWRVQMHWTTKIRLYFVFSVGAMSCIGSVLRQLAQANIGLDPTYNVIPLFTWSLVDLTCGVLAASLPVLSALIPNPWKDTAPGGQFKSSSRQRLMRIFNFSGSAKSGGSGGSGGSAAHTSKERNLSLQQPSDNKEGILREHDVELKFATGSEKSIDYRDSTPVKPSTAVVSSDEKTLPVLPFHIGRQVKKWVKM